MNKDSNTINASRKRAGVDVGAWRHRHVASHAGSLQTIVQTSYLLPPASYLPSLLPINHALIDLGET